MNSSVFAKKEFDLLPRIPPAAVVVVVVVDKLLPPRLLFASLRTSSVFVDLFLMNPAFLVGGGHSEGEVFV